MIREGSKTGRTNKRPHREDEGLNLTLPHRAATSRHPFSPGRSMSSHLFI
jgi:hypothetical protein